MTADQLRRAAAKLRETAAPLLPVSGDLWVSFYLEADHALTRADSAWIALMDPALADPLAAWFEDTAADMTTERRSEPTTSSEQYAVTVARAILGEVPDG